MKKIILNPTIFSPNTPGLRSLQQKDDLANLLSEINKAWNALNIQNPPPLLLKLAPDLTTEEKKDIAAIVMKKHTKVDGLIISNTTVDRSSLLNKQFCNEIGGLSGKPLTDKSTEIIKEMYKLTGGENEFPTLCGLSFCLNLYSYRQLNLCDEYQA